MLRDGHNSDIVQTLRAADSYDRSTALYRSFFDADREDYYIDNREGLKGLLVCLAGVYVPQAEDLSHGVVFDPPLREVDASTSIVEVSVRGPGSASVDQIHNAGLSVLRKKLSLVGCPDIYADFGDFCLSEAVDPKYIVQRMRHIPQIADIEWLAHRPSTDSLVDNSTAMEPSHTTAA